MKLAKNKYCTVSSNNPERQDLWKGGTSWLIYEKISRLIFIDRGENR
jgi:hypothetical protein